MNLKNIRADLQKEAVGEAKQDAALEAEIEQRRRTWARITKYLGLFSAAAVLSVTPFLAGYSLHRYWETAGRFLLILAMGLLLALLYAGGTTYNFWSYLRAIRNLHEKYSLNGVLEKIAVRRSRLKRRLKR